MTRSEYFSRLDKLLQCIESEEREAALRYYNEYFDDAGIDNESAVMEELGTPEELAREIITQVVNEKAESAKEKEYDNAHPHLDGFSNIDVDVINAKVTICKGADYAVDIIRDENSPTKTEAYCADNTLYIKEEMKSRRLFRGFLNTAHKPTIIEITVPDISLGFVKAETVNGNMTVNGISARRLKAETVNGSLGAYDSSAEEMRLECVNGSVASMGCSASDSLKVSTVNGSATVAGVFEGHIKAESINGSVRVSVGKSISLYNAELSAVSGSIYINDIKQKGKSVVVKSNVARHSIKASTVNGSIRLEFCE